MLDSHQAFDGKEYDVKKEIYRLNDRVIVGFSMVFGITTNGSFKIVDDLCERKVICSSAKDNLASALAISLKFKLYNDLLAEKQDEAETVYFSNKETVQTSGVYKYTLYNQAVLLDSNVSGKYFQGDASMEMSLHSKIIKLNSNLKNVSVNAEAITEKEHLATFQIASREKLQEYDSPNHLPKHMHNKDCEFLTVSIKSHANQLNITDKNDIAYTVDKNNPKNTNVNQSLYIKDKSGVDKSLKESKADVENIISVTDSILHNYMKGDLETAYQLIEDSRELLFTSFSFDDQIQFLLNRAENAKTNKDISALIGSVDLASKSFNTGNSKPEAKFFKLNGECQLYMKNYRTAEISFNQAVGFHRSATTGLGFHHYFEYAETLIGLVKSRLVFNKLEEALCTCEEGIAIISSIETQLMTSRLLVQLFYLAAKCKFQISKNLTLEDNLKQVMIFCQHALETSEFVDRLTGTNDLTEELAIGNGEFFALKCEIRLLMASTLLRQKKLEEAQKIAKDLNEFLQNLFVVFEMFSKDTWPSGKNDFITIQCSLFSLNGRALVISNETEDALINLKKSLAIVFTLPSVQAVVTVEEIITLIDAITVIAAKTSIKKSCSPLQEALKICKSKFLEENENLEKLWKFFDSLGNIYVNKNRNVEAIIVYEAGLLLADCLEDASESRGQTLLNLANAHRLRAINDDVQPNVSEKHGLAEKYYQTPNGFGTENSSVFKHIMYAYFLYDECRFREAEMILKQTVEDDKLWSREVFCEYSQRILFGSDIQFYVESFGELHTNMGNLAYSLLVRVYVQLGNKREAVISFDKLSTEGRDLQTGLGITTVCLSYLLEKSEKYLVSLIEEPGKLSFDESDFPLSTENLAKVYYELGEYAFTLNMCVTARKFTFLSTECQLSMARLEGNASVMFAESDTRHPYKTFLHLLQQQEKIFNKSFDDQHAILSQYSFPKPYFIYSSLARMLDDKKIDNKIACYEHCLRMDRGYDIDQNMVGTLTELYQAKAFTEGKNDKIVYQSWMEKAQTCFQKLLERKIKMTPFVEIVYASFLKRIKRFDEAIFLLEQIISKDKDDWSITFSEVDVPLFGVYVAQEIKARVKLSLPKQIFVYYQTVLVYLESGNLENAKECALRMETYVNSLTYDTIVHSFLGYTFKEIGKKQKAQEILQLVLNKEPDNEPVKLALVEF
ncbi:uncharacterized protein LOC124455394 [Xenia sp. Carnegie-2017]|uniref:uncharacterized protein LOC124455394 n=1 Tax=Xenia sp. Carnegie-2017 TaxID=2897299 RepID=UPI001F046014|nr:uncharacterized protein LOC124455394 [Xenia sp. Carnegie-2017]